MIRTVTPIFSIIVALLVFFFYTKPMFATIEQIEDEAKQYEAAVSSATELNGELQKKLSEKRSYPADALERLETLIPASIDEIRILNDLDARATEHNLLFGNVSVAEKEKTNQSDEVAALTEGEVSYDTLATSDISFSLIGTYEQFKAFLADIEQSLVLVEITGIEFTSSDGPLAQYNLTARVFSLPSEE